MNCAEAFHMLDPYMDGALGLERSVDVERHLAACAGCDTALASRRALRTAVRQKLEYYRAPAVLRQTLDREHGIVDDRARRGAFGLWRVSRDAIRRAASFLVVAGLSSGLTYYALPGGADLIANEVFASYVRGVQSEARIVDVVSSDRHTVKPWLDARLDFAVPVTDLASAGFPLVGGRVDYIGDRMAAALVYRSRQHVVTLFVWPDEGRARRLEHSVRRGENLATWSDGRMAYWAISDVAAPDLLAFCARYAAAVRSSDAPLTAAARRE